MKKISAWFLCLCLVIGLLSSFAGAEEDGSEGFSSSYKGAALPFRTLTAEEITSEMGTGCSLGNTLNASNTYSLSQALFEDNESLYRLLDAVQASGFGTVRIPVTLTAAIDKEHNYAIDSEWLNKVRSVVDYALSLDLYVILGLDGDTSTQGGWILLNENGFDSVKSEFTTVWKKLATAFRCYDEHLIFEGMSGAKESADRASSIRMVNELNRAFVAAVRSAGDNNEERWLIVSGLDSSISGLTDSGFTLPDDEHLMVSFQYSDAFSSAGDAGTVTYSLNQLGNAAQSFAKLADSYVSKGVPVVLSEYGAADKANTEERAYYAELINALCRQDGIVPVYNDNGVGDSGKKGTALFDRTEYTELFPEITAAALRGFFTGYESFSDVKKPAEASEESKVTLTVPETELTLSVGEYLTASVTAEGSYVTWTSENPKIATVNGGTIHAKSVGTTVLTVKAGTVSETVTVHVTPNVTVPYVICTAASEAELTAGENIYLNPSLTDAMGIAKSDDAVLYTYQSSDPSVATVTGLGMVTAVSEGTAYIVISGSMGSTAAVKVIVEGGSSASVSSPEFVTANVGTGSTEVTVSGITGSACLVSGNPETLSVSALKAEAAADGTVTFAVYGAKDGTAELTVYPENGEPVTKTVLISSNYRNQEENDAGETEVVPGGGSLDEDPSETDSGEKTASNPAAVSTEDVGYTKMTGKTYGILAVIIVLCGLTGAGIYFEAKKQKENAAPKN